MRQNIRRIGISLIPLGLLLGYMVACQSGSTPFQPDTQPGHELTSADEGIPNTTDETRLGSEALESEAAEAEVAEMTRLERQLMLPAVGELSFEVDTEFPVRAGDEIVVIILVRDIDDMFGCGFEIGFNEEVVEVKEVDLDGCILGDDLLSLTQVIIPGELPIGITRKRTDEGLSGVSGDGILATVNFTALGILDSSEPLDLEILTRDTIPRYTRADLSEARFELSEESIRLIGETGIEGVNE